MWPLMKVKESRYRSRAQYFWRKLPKSKQFGRIYLKFELMLIEESTKFNLS